MKIKTAVVILNWNGKRYLEQFLPLVILRSNQQATIIVADNGSTDGSVEMLQENFPEVQIIINETNEGYAGGYNAALKKIDAEYYILLNSDIEVGENWIEPVIALMDADKSIAAAQPKILSYLDPASFEYAGGAGGFIDTFGYPFCRGRIFQTLEKDNGQYNDVCEIFWATGACMFVRAEIFHNEHGFDADFFAHMEEIDLCWRIKNKGYRIMYCPDSVVYHIGGGTLPKNSPKKTYLNMRNNIYLLFKNLPASKLIPIFFLRFMMDGLASIKFLIDGGIADFMAVVKAHMSFYCNINKLIKKRKNIQPHKVGIFHGNIVWEYYILRKRTFSELPKKRFHK
ncbi:MAG: glycosyltransferase family 2 protein [Bacteroidetes bacterium]|nr:glycosyltransferase family 2 protein [Bacteroidota bacterium]